MMLWLILMISFSPEICTKLILNDKKVSWNEIKEHCDVQAKSEVEQNKNLELQLYQHVTAWTASWVNVNDWAHFYGCLDLEINHTKTSEIKSQLRTYFQNENSATDKDCIFDCVAECFKQADYFIYYKKICQCVTTPSQTDKKQTCITSCQFYNDVFCSSGKGLALFKIERDIETDMAIFDNISSTRRCLASKNNTNVVTDCSSTYNFSCEGSGSVYEFNWTRAVNTCTNKNRTSTLPLTSKSSNIFSWLGYFSVRQLLNESSHRLCTVVSWSRGSYQYENRNCSERLPFICQVTESGLTTLTDTATPVTIDNDASTRQTTNVKNSKPVVIITVNVVLLVLCIVVMIAYCHIKKIKETIQKRSSKQPSINQNAAPLVRVHVHYHRHNDGEVNPFQNGDVEGWDESRDIVGIEELYHDVYEDVQIEQIGEH